METQKIVNLLGDKDYGKFRKWYVINDQNNGVYCEGNENNSSMKLETKVIKSSICDYSDAYVLVTGDITVTGGNANTRVMFKNCDPFGRGVTHINDERIDTAENLDIIMTMYNLLEYYDNYADPSASLYQLKKMSRVWIIMKILLTLTHLIQHSLNTNQVF